METSWKSLIRCKKYRDKSQLIYIVVLHHLFTHLKPQSDKCLLSLSTYRNVYCNLTAAS